MALVPANLCISAGQIQGEPTFYALAAAIYYLGIFTWGFIRGKIKKPLNFRDKSNQVDIFANF